MEEIFPKKDLDKLKHDISDLKTKADFPKLTNTDVLQSMAELKKSVDLLLGAMKEVGSRGSHESVNYNELIHKIDRISVQNQKIADALVAIADMIKDSHHIPMPRPQPIVPQPKPLPPPRMHHDIPPPPRMNSPMQGNRPPRFPPPPNLEEHPRKKRGLF